METLEDKWKHFTLTELEGEEIFVNEQLIAKEIKRGENSIVEKLLVERKVNREIIRSTMSKAWKTTKIFNVVEIKPNLFIISFENKDDKEKVI